MLIIVPLMAGTWPAIRLYVNQHNKKASETAARLERAQTRFMDGKKEFVADISKASRPESLKSAQETDVNNAITRTIDRVEKSIEALDETVAAFKEDFADRALKDPKMPWGFAAAFFAALCAVLGQLIYQLFASEIIKAAPLDEFVSSRKKDYASHPTEAALERARVYVLPPLPRELRHGGFQKRRVMDLLADLYPLATGSREARLQTLTSEFLDTVHELLTRSTPESPNGIRLEEVYAVISGDRKHLESQLAREVEAKRFIGDVVTLVERLQADPDRRSFVNLSLIEKGAEAEYKESAARNPIAATLSVLLYGAAVYMILAIIVTQVISVTSAAGFRSALDVFIKR